MVEKIHLLIMATLLYNPDRKNRQAFIDEFVIRTRIFDDIFNDIKKGKMKYPEQHYMLLGQRGAGKTTLLLRLKYAIEDDQQLNKWLIPVIFSEEQYHIGEIVNIWEHIAAYLEDRHNFSGICSEMAQFAADKDFEAMAFDILTRHLDKRKKKLVLFIDNVGDLLKKLDRLEIFRLREILQTKPHLRLIAASSSVLDGILDYQQPFFEFFKMIQLKGLTYDESTALLRKLGELHGESKKIDRIIRDTPSRIETLRTLSGGVPRTIALLFQVFVDDEHGNAVSDLEKILDAVTPLYKHRMDDLPAQQQKIVDAVARNWEAVSVRQLTERLRLESKVISAQLRQLEKNQVIEKRTTGTKNHIYLLRERFFNIWYLMRYGRKEDRQRVIWLVKFLEVWCDPAEIRLRIKDYIQKVEKGALDEQTKEFFAQVYSHFKEIDPETKFLLKESAAPYIAGHIDLTEEEFDALFNKYLYRKDWKPFLRMIATRERFTSAQQKKLCDLVMNPSQFQVRFKNIPGNAFSAETDAQLLILMGCYMYALFGGKGGEEFVRKSARAVEAIVKTSLQRSSFDAFMTKVFDQIIMNLIVLGYPQLAASMIDSIIAQHGQSFKHQAPLSSFLAEYFSDPGRGREMFEALGSELEGPLQRLIDYVSDARKTRAAKTTRS